MRAEKYGKRFSRVFLFAQPGLYKKKRQIGGRFSPDMVR